MTEFSNQLREKSLERFSKEKFDLLIVGGGITGAAVARDAVTRGLNVALIEERDFAFGTSSRSSKLIHGGLRYLENFEFSLVFEALAERSFLLKKASNLVRPLEFYMPVYESDPHGVFKLSLGLNFYDLLTLFRTPGWHKKLSARKMKEAIPFLKADGLKGGFRYYDASMWDDVLAVETLRSAAQAGAAIANYCAADVPIVEDGQLKGFRLEKRLPWDSRDPIELRAHKTVITVGPWADIFCRKIDPNWKPWLKVSKGVHLVFSLKRIPIPGAVVMSHPTDGRIVFVIPRPDYGEGVVIVGTTDGPTPEDPAKARVEQSDIDYLLSLLRTYFPEKNLSEDDILSGYVGVRPLVGGAESEEALQKVSREHEIGPGPGGSVLVAGGKYTTHIKMAEEIVEYVLEDWREDSSCGRLPELPPSLQASKVRDPINASTLPGPLDAAKAKAEELGREVDSKLWDFYGGEALRVLDLVSKSDPDDPDGMPAVAAQLRFQIREGMVQRLEDFYLRRVSLFLSRKDHGAPWIEPLSKIWAEELGRSEEERMGEVNRIQEVFDRRDGWRKEH